MTVIDTQPPKANLNPLNWLKKNLFNNWYNTILTIISLLFIVWIFYSFINWAIPPAECLTKDNAPRICANYADWNAVTENMRLFFVGYYPEELLWRTWASFKIIVALSGFSWGIFSASSTLFNRATIIVLSVLGASYLTILFSVGFESQQYLVATLFIFAITTLIGKKLGTNLPDLKLWLPLVWFFNFFLVLWLLQGGLFLESVGLDNLSGIILTFLAAIVSIVLCFPFGILLALGRQSHLPIIRWLSTIYIEIIRGLPLIGILFMAQVMLPLVLPPDLRLSRVVRAIAGFTIFASAYLAENVRGGLQSVPRGQSEAAKALGLNGPLVLALIVLPQALRAVIPSIVGQFISLFKDTSLLAIVGLVDLLGISQSILLGNPEYNGRSVEIYLFVGFIYWICCYSMSLASRNLEK
ncbi:MAG: amino acid ABC transporter permease [Prochloraceae cyanobacterium]|nr:amino acid ABC transporter permease [Prochloraceae cyanobacterium]